MDKDYSKREIDKYFMDINEKIDTNHKENHDAWIKTGEAVQDLANRVAIQNGRVGKLEAQAKSIIVGCSVGVFLIGIIISLVVYSFQISMENQRNTILLEFNTILQKSIQQALSAYELPQ